MAVSHPYPSTVASLHRALRRGSSLEVLRAVKGLKSCEAENFLEARAWRRRGASSRWVGPLGVDQVCFLRTQQGERW